MRGGRGPNLAKIGSKHDVAWLQKFITNPKSEKEHSRMPKFEDKLSADDIHAVAEYLGSLK
jgi:cbb3-type cytochrome oxidase cytochrome c subunit